MMAMPFVSETCSQMNSFDIRLHLYRNKQLVVVFSRHYFGDLNGSHTVESVFTKPTLVNCALRKCYRPPSLACALFVGSCKFLSICKNGITSSILHTYTQ